MVKPNLGEGQADGPGSLGHCHRPGLARPGTELNPEMLGPGMTPCPPPLSPLVAYCPAGESERGF